MTKNETGRIQFQCPSLSAKPRVYSIFLDGKKISKIKEGETETISATPGIHTVQLKLAWIWGYRLQVNIEENKTTQLHVEQIDPSRQIWKVVILCFFVGVSSNIFSRFNFILHLILSGILGGIIAIIYTKIACRPKLVKV